MTHYRNKYTKVFVDTFDVKFLTLNKEKKLDENYTRMLGAVLN